MKSKSSAMVFILIIIVTLILFTVLCSRQSGKHIPSSVTQHQHKLVATLFMHGYGGSEKLESFMVNQAVKKGVTKDVMIAKVSRNGNVTFIGSIDKNVKNPIIKIEFENNRNGDFNENARWIKNVLSQLKSQYNINKFNFVAHSMGNMSFAYYMNNYGNDKYLPHLQKEVNIAGTYNGVLNLNEKINEINLDQNGKPNKMNDDFKKLLSLKEVYKDKNIDVLNIYGDIQDGTHSDGRVSNSSSKSLKYLLGNSPKSYTENKFTGKTAQHSQLHENKNIANDIIQFLWSK
ncbi:alpha/beta hydrolase [Staphylococcus capitis]|uniref:alpha/beta hydrolase n=1 Tax=Staphylococcus capitis TaxID=29388 RepID=UPI00352C69F8